MGGRAVNKKLLSRCLVVVWPGRVRPTPGLATHPFFPVLAGWVLGNRDRARIFLYSNNTRDLLGSRIQPEKAGSTPEAGKPQKLMGLA